MKRHIRRFRDVTAELGWGDVVAFAWTALFFGWLIFDWFGQEWATAIDFVLFAPLGLAVGLLQLHVANRVEDRRERLAWRLLAAAAFARFVSGSVWGFAVSITGGGGSPPWMIVLACAYLVFGIAGLITFPGVRWRPIDRRRYHIDAAIVLIGSLLVVWFFALGPFFRTTGESMARLQDYIYTIGDSVTVVLAAGLYLRCGTVMMRTVSVVLLLAFTLQVFPDVVLYSGVELHTYHAGDAIAGVWYAVWALKWISARYAFAQVRHPHAESRRLMDTYHSGIMPHLFLYAAALVLLHQLLTGNRLDSALFVIGSASLAGLLVARHAVELRERDRLLAMQLAEEGWYRALLHHAWDLVVLLDRDGRATYVSPSTTRLLGDAVDLSGPWGLLEAAHPDDAARLRAELRGSALRSASVTLACRMRDAAGGWRHLSLQLHDLTGNPLVGAIVVSGHDQTKEVRLEQRLHESREVEALGTFASGLAHDLNNILTVIGSHVDLLRSEPMARSQAADLRAISAATIRAASLTRGLLALSRRKSATRRPVDVAVLVRERLDAQRSTGEWPVTLLGDSRIVHADPLALGQVVDCILNDVTFERREGALTMVTHVVDANDASVLDIDPGTYIVLHVGGGATDGDAPDLPHIPTAGAEWDASPDDLGMLVALTAVREVGGTLTIEGRGERRHVAVYLPSAAA